jgi:predicted nuclease of predicted toxin-antitoxin system
VRLLFDENLSARLVGLLADAYSGSAHLEHAGLLGAADAAVWAHAAAGGYVPVTKDEDFQRLSVVRGQPPKVVWVRLGNCATADVARLPRLRRDDLARFVAHEDAAFPALG